MFRICIIMKLQSEYVSNNKNHKSLLFWSFSFDFISFWDWFHLHMFLLLQPSLLFLCVTPYGYKLLFILNHFHGILSFPATLYQLDVVYALWPSPRCPSVSGIPAGLQSLALPCWRCRNRHTCAQRKIAQHCWTAAGLYKDRPWICGCCHLQSITFFPAVSPAAAFPPSLGQRQHPAALG